MRSIGKANGRVDEPVPKRADVDDGDELSADVAVHDGIGRVPKGAIVGDAGNQRYDDRYAKADANASGADRNDGAGSNGGVGEPIYIARYSGHKSERDRYERQAGHVRLSRRPCRQQGLNPFEGCRSEESQGLRKRWCQNGFRTAEEAISDG